MHIFNICSTVVSGVGFLLNLLIIIVILVDPLKILRKGSWITIINLTAADLVVCVNEFFWRIQQYVGTSELRTTTYIFVMNFLMNLAISASFMLLAFFSLQVYTVTKFPFKAPHFWKHKRVVLCCVGIWLLAGLLGCSSIFSDLHYDYDIWNVWYTVQAVVRSIIVIIQIVLKILTCREIFKTRRNSGQSQSLKHRQITITVMIMVSVQMFTAFPFVVINQLALDMLSLNKHLLVKILTYYMPLSWLNFSVNPIIYFLRLPDFRSSLFSLCGCRKCKNKTSSDPQRNEQRELPLHHVPPTTPQSSS